jgi:hypothetical protein
MLLVLLFLTITLFVFKNSLYFTIILLVISVLTLSSLVLNTYLSTLTAFMLVIVYVGAIIVLIGYICAISPNLVLEPDFRLTSPFILVFSLFLFFDGFKVPTFNLSTFTLVDFFYSYQGLFVFLSLVFMLFLTLLIVTSQYSVPQGPFRSLQQ